MDSKNRVSDNDTSKQQCITPVKDGKFQFSCHKGVPCFTDCCRDLRLILTPYDIIRLKNRLGLSSKEFLDTHTVSEFDTAMGLPTVLLKMKEDEIRHADQALHKGGKPLPEAIKQGMRLMSKVMTTTAYRI